MIFNFNIIHRLNKMLENIKPIRPPFCYERTMPHFGKIGLKPAPCYPYILPRFENSVCHLELTMFLFTPGVAKAGALGKRCAAGTEHEDTSSCILVYLLITPA